MSKARDPFLNLFIVGLGFFLSVGCQQVKAEGVCRQLISTIAQEVGVPERLLTAMARVESGHQCYAVNNSGQSLTFKTMQEAKDYVQEQIQQGNENIDLGCLQVNWRYHQQHFTSPTQLLHPYNNIRYAALFLKQLYHTLGSWSKAVGAYHSRTLEKGQGYMVKVAAAIHQENQIYLR